MSEPVAPTVTQIVQRGLYVEEFEVGAVYLHRPGRTATEADNVLFSSLTMNTQALHLDAAFAATQPFGQRLMNSMWTLATMVGSSVAQLTQGTLVAQLGLGDVRFPHPLFAGDTLYTETAITEVRLSRSRPGQGIVTMAHTGRNQNDDIVAQATRTALMWCRPDASAAGSPGASVSPAASASHAPHAPQSPQSPMEDA
ncbi:MAG TPA: MaoC family dehydratase [Microbacterium sp.]|nr:MaoC family dehydratase [Microbacterium sp.]